MSAELFNVVKGRQISIFLDDKREHWQQWRRCWAVMA
jgi:hypothetical protein